MTLPALKVSPTSAELGRISNWSSPMQSLGACEHICWRYYEESLNLIVLLGNVHPPSGCTEGLEWSVRQLIK